MINISDNLQTIGAKLKQYARDYNRPPQAVQLLAVSKRHSSESIRQAYGAGQRAFGENYVQELLEKHAELASLDIDWHYIGPLQSNKAKKIAEVASWVHTVDRLKIAQRLSANRPAELPPLSVCLQVNISGEATKSGVNADELFTLAQNIVELPQLTLRGLMVIPAPETDFVKQRKVFAEVARLQHTLQQFLDQHQLNYQLDTLSMGMSGDIEAAVAEGATIVRVGTAIFGPRAV